MDTSPKHKTYLQKKAKYPLFPHNFWCLLPCLMLMPFAYGYLNFGLLNGIYGASITALSMMVIWTVVAYNTMRDRFLVAVEVIKSERKQRNG